MSEQWETVAVTELRENDRIRQTLDGRVETAVVDRAPRIGETGVYVRLYEHGTVVLRSFKPGEQVERKIRQAAGRAETKPADHSQCEHPDDEQTRTECEQQARTWDAMWSELGR